MDKTNIRYHVYLKYGTTVKDRAVWNATQFTGVAKNWTQLSD